MHPHEETAPGALQLALTDSGVPHAATSTATATSRPSSRGTDRQDDANAFDAAVLAHAQHQHQQQQQQQHGGDEHGSMLPLAMPPSPTLMSHGHAASAAVAAANAASSSAAAALHHVYASHARLAMLSEAGGVGVGVGVGVGADLHGLNVHSYFPSDADADAAALAGIGVGHFEEMKLDGDATDKTHEYHHHQHANANTSSTTTSTTTRKRKVGTNASIDLQTKIRLIELAEEFQYDPKSGARGGKHDASANSATATANARDAMSGIRLAAQFGLNKSTVSRILKRKEEFKKAYYKDNISGCSKHINKKSKFEKLNRLVENWFDVTREKKVAVSDTLIRDVGKRFAEELGIEDFRGSNGWVRSLRNRKEQQARNMSLEAMERERVKKDAEAVERVRAMFPAGMKDMASFFKDMTIFLERDGGGLGLANVTNPPATYMETLEGDDGLQDADKEAEEFLKKKMIESMRLWAQELMELELAKMKKRLKPRPVVQPLQQQQQQIQPPQLQQQQQQQQQQLQQPHQTAVI